MGNNKLNSTQLNSTKFPSSWRQIFEMLPRVKFLRIEISYDCVVIKGYQTRTKKYYNGKLSFH